MIRMIPAVIIGIFFAITAIQAPGKIAHTVAVQPEIVRW